MFDTCVIGGNGFIGRPLVRALADTGRKVLVIGRRQTSLTLPEGVSYCALDIENTAELMRKLQGIPELVDLAYGTVPKTSFDDPVADVVANLPASVALLAAASDLGLRAFILVSSGGTVYGEPETLPIAENHPLRPLSPYGITKHSLERYGALYHRSAQLPVIIARPANAYGEAQDGSRGQGFIGAAVKMMLEGKPVPVFGETGTVRDYIHVEDVAKGLLATLERGRVGESYNIGSGRGYNNAQILELLAALAERMGLARPVQLTMPARPFDVSANVLTPGKLLHETGWQPTIALEEGLERVLKHALAER